jgi:hypothetical protein
MNRIIILTLLGAVIFQKHKPKFYLMPQKRKWREMEIG